MKRISNIIKAFWLIIFSPLFWVIWIVGFDNNNWKDANYYWKYVWKLLTNTL